MQWDGFGQASRENVPNTLSIMKGMHVNNKYSAVTMFDSLSFDCGVESLLTNAFNATKRARK